MTIIPNKFHKGESKPRAKTYLKKMQIFVFCCFAVDGKKNFNQKKFGKLKSGAQLCASSL